MSNPEMNVDQRPQRKPENVNTSGKGPNAPVPSAVKNKFNWGAFFLSWIWGLYHKAYLTLLVFLALPVAIFLKFLFPEGNTINSIVNVVNIILCIWFGIKGNEWAWQGRHYKSISQFHESQKKWVKWYLIILFVILPLLGVLAALTIPVLMHR